MVNSRRLSTRRARRDLPLGKGARNRLTMSLQEGKNALKYILYS